MRRLPVPDPGEPDLRGPGRFLLRVVRLQAATVALGALYGVLWMGGQALSPYVLGRAVDDGLAAVGGVDLEALGRWCLVLLALGALQAVSGVLRHRCAVGNYLQAQFRVTQWAAAGATRLGAALAPQVPPSEMANAGATDAVTVARTLDVTARASGAVVALVLVAVLLLGGDPALGLVILLGVPLFLLGLGPLLRPLHARQSRQRDALGDLTGLGADTVQGLRVLRGIGGEPVFVARYGTESQRVRRAGVDVARTQSLLEAAQVLLPGLLVVLVSWIAARSAVEGRTSPGELVAAYGYAAFLATPLRTLTEIVDKATRAYVASRRLIRVLSLRPLLAELAEPAPAPPPGRPLVDRESGLVVEPGLLTAVVSEVPEHSSALADRLGRYTDADVRWDGTPLAALLLAEVRRRVLVADSSPVLFSGALREELGGTDRDLRAALDAACLQDVVDGLPGGLDELLGERAGALSGGQRQRVALARALAADAEVLVLVEPTSAVDAHTEARIAVRLRALRAGRTTVVCTTSPLLLDAADRVALLVDGRVVAQGTHRELLAEGAYRSVVVRGAAA